MPEAKSAASKLVKFAPLTAGKVAGNLASGIVPDPNAAASVDEIISTLKFEAPSQNTVVLAPCAITTPFAS